MPHKGEIVSEKDRRVHSDSVANGVIFSLSYAIVQLRKGGIKGWTKNGRTTFQASEHIHGRREMSDAQLDREYRIRDSIGYIDGARLRLDDQSRFKSASITRVLPAKYSDKKSLPPFKSDYDVARLRAKYHDGTEIGPRVILDMWRLPTTQLTELLRERGSADEAYDHLYRRIFRQKSAQGIPLAAENVTHMVLGCPDEVVSPRELNMLGRVVSGISLAVQSEVVYQAEIDSEIAAGILD